MPCRLPVTLPAAGVEPAPAACAAVHHYTTLALSPAMLCYKTCYKQHICNASKTICKAFMRHCYRCRKQLTNVETPTYSPTQGPCRASRCMYTSYTP